MTICYIIVDQRSCNKKETRKMKIKNFLCRTIDGGFFLARGSLLIDDDSLAIVKSWSEPVVTPRYSIIDVASGLFVSRGSSKKKLLEKWEQEKEERYPKIKHAREEDFYIQRVLELNEEKKVWRNSGYVL